MSIIYGAVESGDSIYLNKFDDNKEIEKIYKAEGYKIVWKKEHTVPKNVEAKDLFDYMIKVKHGKLYYAEIIRIKMNQ